MRYTGYLSPGENRAVTFKEYRFLVKSDLYRVAGSMSASKLVRHLLFGGTFKLTYWLRTCSYLKKTLWRYSLYWLARMMLHRYIYRFGISISPSTEIGSGFFILHCGGIVVSEQSKIGKNCNMSHGVTLGRGIRGKNAGHPRIGDNVYIGPGAKIFGGVTVGNNVAIGANCVVNINVPDNAVVVGIPARIVSYQGSTGYVKRTDYDRMLQC